jgi:hypothetical protein
VTNGVSVPAGAKVFQIPLSSVAVPDTTALAFMVRPAAAGGREAGRRSGALRIIAGSTARSAPAFDAAPALNLNQRTHPQSSLGLDDRVVAAPSFCAGSCGQFVSGA